MFFKRIFCFCSLICGFVLLHGCVFVLLVLLVLFVLYGTFWCFLVLFGALGCFWCVRNLFVKKKKKEFKAVLITSFILLLKIDIICLSQTYLDASISSYNDNLELPGYNLVRADNPTNTKRGGVIIIPYP